MLKIEKLNDKIPVYDIGVLGNHNFFANNVLVHNCTEIVQVTRPSKLKSSKLTYDSDMNPIITKEYDAGEIALCNLCSLNLYDLYNGKLTDDEIYDVVYETLEAMDSTFDVQFYPVLEAEYSNKIWRYIGIGFLNYAKLLANEKIEFGSQESKEYTAELMDDITYKIYDISNKLAEKKGKFSKFKTTRWAEGQLPVFLANKHALNLTEFKPDYEKWNRLSERIKRNGLRFGLHIAVAPTACQTIDTKIKTKVGIKSFEDICNENDINWKNIEEKNEPSWFNFKQLILVDTRKGFKKTNRIWFNGKQKTKKITFDDDKTFEFTLNHKLLLKREEKEIWVEVKDLKVGDEIVNVNEYSKMMKIKKIEEGNIKPTWDIEVLDGNEYLLENGIVTHNTSGSAINSTPSTEPVFDLIFKEEGEGSTVTLSPDIKRLGMYYKAAFDINNKDLIELAAIRQIYIDQAQSINLYFKPPFSLKEQTDLHFYSHHLGLKTLYYFQTKKDGDDQVCESCS